MHISLGNLLICKELRDALTTLHTWTAVLSERRLARRGAGEAAARGFTARRVAPADQGSERG